MAVVLGGKPLRGGRCNRIAEIGIDEVDIAWRIHRRVNGIQGHFVNVGERVARADGLGGIGAEGAGTHLARFVVSLFGAGQLAPLPVEMGEAGQIAGILAGQRFRFGPFALFLQDLDLSLDSRPQQVHPLVALNRLLEIARTEGPFVVVIRLHSCQR